MSSVDYQEAYELWHSDYTLRGTTLFEALPDWFSFDDLMTTADRLEISSIEAVEHLRIMQREQLIGMRYSRFYKTKDARPA
jgi:hypothetical protein